MDSRSRGKAPCNERDKQVGQCVVDGKDEKEIGMVFGKSDRTARRYKEDLFKKLGARTLVEAVAILVKLGISPSNDH